MFQKLNELKELVAQLEQELRTKGEVAFKEAVTELFDKFPGLESLHWWQYTPYFNDGEPCVFSVRDIEYGFNDVNFLKEILKEGRLYQHSYNSTTRAYENGKARADEDLISGEYVEWSFKEGTEFKEILQEFNTGFHSLTDVLETLFGDHMEVTVTREGFKAEEYDHE